jgi:hypothetical protein
VPAFRRHSEGWKLVELDRLPTSRIVISVCLAKPVNRHHLAIYSWFETKDRPATSRFIVRVAQTIVRKVRGGSDPAEQRFVILYESAVGTGGFLFTPASITMTFQEVCVALIAAGISERDAMSLINDAVTGSTHT